MLHWPKRLREWRAVMAQAVAGQPWHWRWRFYVTSAFRMTRAILSGPVPADVWRDRIHTCFRCPILDRKTLACRMKMGDEILGCQCYTVALALTAAPYPGGCYARNLVSYEGWPSYHFQNRRAKLKAVWRFFFPPKSP